MINNYLKMAWRILIRQRLFSAINILGLVIGMVATLLIVQYISFELSFDDFQQHADRIYRVKHQNYRDGSLIENTPKTYSAVGPAIKAEILGVAEQTRVSKLEGQVSTQQAGKDAVAFNERHLYLADRSFLKMFSFRMVEGTTAALDGPNAVVLTETTAKKYFSGQDALGKTIRIQQNVSGTNITATVTGVCKDVPANSHLQFDFLVSQDLQAGDWVYADSYTYLLLSPKTDHKMFEAMLPAFIKRHSTGNDKIRNSSFTQGKSNLSSIVLTLQPLRDIHLYANLSDEISPGGNGNMVWYLGIIAALILIIAYINYINLTTAKIIERTREVGIRKVLGSQRLQLILQFLLESLVLNSISVIIAVVAVMMLMPWFSALCGVNIQFTLWQNGLFLAGFVGCLLSGILLSAFYPALILSNYRPVQILKGRFQTGGQGISLRKSLVVFQFAATITFMIGTLVVYSQVNYMKTGNNGMDMKQTLVLMAPQNVRQNDAEAMDFMHRDSVFQTELMRSPRVQGVTSSSSIPGEVINYTMAYTRPQNAAEEKSIRLPTLEIGSSFLNQFKVKIIAGNNFSAAARSAGSAMMLNEAAVVSLGFKNPQDAVGKIIQTKNGRGRIFENTIAGVVKNFHQTSLKEDFTPTVFRLIDPSSVTHYELKVNTADLPATMAQINKTYKSVFPDAAFDYFFLDEFFDQQYKAEQHFGKIFSLFSGLAILVACLGLFGLTLITVNQRIKEIGVRKILGASIPNILLLISKDFIGLLGLACAIAVPVAYWGSYRWLQNYIFRINFSVWFFIVPMASVLIMALATISLQAIKAALANPIKSLKAE
ncbi:ABC transporter permease [Mucilaginibacter phyllosphaerae]|uniref:ABC transport system permease protein n=1 Tax=Mucilaginibacter phyllosphaerae TaxID=1812349 RepID=A0A4Y8A998_9SPHI|nr:ABC transporter permease [Mucilaginibacter phyllosphaerae]MBB3969619.1 putative ABC transport system permease protein [Mucilaginibacter phyllosphaerae]TEW65006.1 ABC transporter permease [Mucilaginibacter phyllosphaerae]GGH18565.1 ABC transporter permease [Mucilaginibacter phyllosphaerae]